MPDRLSAEDEARYREDVANGAAPIVAWALLAEIDALRERVAEVERERREAVNACDENWVSHQHVVATRKRAEQAEARVAALEKALATARTINGLHMDEIGRLNDVLDTQRAALEEK
jgi:polyhydroxyalkanoate synthesis regulator phasin